MPERELLSLGERRIISALIPDCGLYAIALLATSRAYRQSIERTYYEAVMVPQTREDIGHFTRARNELRLVGGFFGIGQN